MFVTTRLYSSLALLLNVMSNLVSFMVTFCGFAVPVKLALFSENNDTLNSFEMPSDGTVTKAVALHVSSSKVLLYLLMMYHDPEN